MRKRLICLFAAVCLCVYVFIPAYAKALDITTGVITGSDVAMREEADINSAVIMRLNKGSTVKILKTNVNAEWDQVVYKGKTGYVNRVYVLWDSSLDQYNYGYAGTVINCDKHINIRTRASTGAKILGTADKGAKLPVLNKSYAKGWAQVSFDSKTGYASTKYLDIGADVDDAHLCGLSVKGGSLTPAFSPYEYGYVVNAASSKVTVTAKANKGVRLDVNGTGKSSAKISVPSGGMKTIRIALNGKVTYTVYIKRNVLTYGTWNIKRGNGNLLMQGRLVYDQLPDIMGIQEVFVKNDPKNRIDNLASLKTKSMTHTRFEPTISYSNGAQYGIGIMSRYKMSGFQAYEIDSGRYEKRILMKAVITIGGKKVSIYNTHFSYESEAVRAGQFAQVVSIMSKDKNKYKILTGDFNAKEAEFAPLGGYTVIINSGTRYYDEAGNEISHGYLDNIVVTKNIRVVNSRIIKSDLSDHYPVFAYLVLK